MSKRSSHHLLTHPSTVKARTRERHMFVEKRKRKREREREESSCQHCSKRPIQLDLISFSNIPPPPPPPPPYVQPDTSFSSFNKSGIIVFDLSKSLSASTSYLNRQVAEVN